MSHHKDRRAFAKKVKAIHDLSPDIQVSEERGCIVLRGEVDDWGLAVKAGHKAVDKKRYLGVINDITLKGFSEEVVVPEVEDLSLDGQAPDVLVIGGGIVGCAVLRELSRWNVDALLVERNPDVAEGQTKANGGVVHTGMTFSKGSQKLHYNMRGNAMYEQLSRDLDVPFERNGQLALSAEPWEKIFDRIAALYSKVWLGIEGFGYIDREDLLKIEPEVPEFFIGALSMPNGGNTSPYGMAFAMAENAVHNGARISLQTMVRGMTVEDGRVTAVETNRGTLYPKIVVNAAGIYSDKIAEMAGDRTFTVHPRKGTYMVTDKEAGHLVRSTMAKSPFTLMPEESARTGKDPVKKVKAVVNNLAHAGHTKGVGLIHSVYGNMLVGPNATETPERENTEVERSVYHDIMDMQMKLSPKLQYSDIITAFTGVRAPVYEEDFVVRRGIFTKNILEAAGVQSPGITAAPAIAEDIAQWAVEDLQAMGSAVSRNEQFDPVRKAPPHVAQLSPEERAALIEKDPAYGVVVCRCEGITLGEIRDALDSDFCVPTVDGIKRRLRPGMGRCQGGFCMPQVMAILAEHEGVTMADIRKDTPSSQIVYQRTK